MEHIEERLVLDWRKKAETREAARGLVKEILDELPEVYDPEIWERKTEIVFNHIFASYYDDGDSVYEATGPTAGGRRGRAIASVAIASGSMSTTITEEVWRGSRRIRLRRDGRGTARG